MSDREARLAVLADHALVGQDGKVSVVGIFRTISVSALPAEHPRMYLVAILALETGPHDVVVQLLRPDGSGAMPNPPQISVHGVAGQDVNVLLELNKVNLGAFGTHVFDIAVDGVSIAQVPLAVEQMTQSSGGRAN